MSSIRFTITGLKRSSGKGSEYGMEDMEGVFRGSIPKYEKDGMSSEATCSQLRSASELTAFSAPVRLVTPIIIKSKNIKPISLSHFFLFSI